MTAHEYDPGDAAAHVHEECLGVPKRGQCSACQAGGRPVRIIEKTGTSKAGQRLWRVMDAKGRRFLALDSQLTPLPGDPFALMPTIYLK